MDGQSHGVTGPVVRVVGRTGSIRPGDIVVKNWGEAEGVETLLVLGIDSTPNMFLMLTLKHGSVTRNHTKIRPRLVQRHDRVYRVVAVPPESGAP